MCFCLFLLSISHLAKKHCEEMIFPSSSHLALPHYIFPYFSRQDDVSQKSHTHSFTHSHPDGPTICQNRPVCSICFCDDRRVDAAEIPRTSVTCEGPKFSSQHSTPRSTRREDYSILFHPFKRTNEYRCNRIPCTSRIANENHEVHNTLPKEPSSKKRTNRNRARAVIN